MTPQGDPLVRSTPVDLEDDAVRVVPEEQLIERCVEERLEVLADRLFDVPGVEWS